MKYISYLLLALLSASTVGALNAATADTFDQMIEFKELLKKHKVEWLNFMAESSKDKFKLLADQAKQKFDFKISKIKQWKKDFESTDMNKKAAMKKQGLIDAVKFYEEQAKQMSEFCMKKFEKARELAKKQKEAMNKFKQNIGLSVDMKEMTKPGMSEMMAGEAKMSSPMSSEVLETEEVSVENY